MMLLRPEAGSKRGSFMNAAESVSVWATGSVSMRDELALTSTLLEIAPICRVQFRLIGTEPRTSIGSVSVVNPGALITNLYTAGGTLLNRNEPVWSVTTICL